VQNFNLDSFRQRPLPNEAEITAHWPRDDVPGVSIVCLTYNHRNYIEDALRGFLLQRTDFPFEIVIHDDASTDGTRQIIEQYAHAYPRLIRPILQDTNRHSQGKKIEPLVASHCRANILAFCEGDDFWIDDNKLKLQKDVLDTNRNIALVVHPCLTTDGSSRYPLAYCKGQRVDRFDAQDVLNVAAQFAPTSSYALRRTTYDQMPAWYDLTPVGDFFLEMYSLKKGIGIYIPNVMSVYRTVSVGSWMDRRRRSRGDELINFGTRMLTCLELIEKEEPFNRLSFKVKKSAVHLELATGYLLKCDAARFRYHIAQSYALHPDSCRIQSVFMTLRSAPSLALYLFKAKRQLNTLLHHA